MKTLAYELHEDGECYPAECSWCDPPSVPPVHARPQSGESGSNLTPGGDGGSEQWKVTATRLDEWVERIAKHQTEERA
jgi:hypothetical protein